MNIDHTRQMVRAALNGALDGVPTRTDPVFGFEVPQPARTYPSQCSGRATWNDPVAYDRAARKLAAMFVENFGQYEGGVSKAIVAAGPQSFSRQVGEL